MKMPQNPSRLVIFFFYDKDGIVDRYIPFMLSEVQKNADEIYVVVNGNLTDEGRNVFKQFAVDVFERENKGFDVWAYKESIERLGWDKLESYDEIVLMNFTMMGPIYPFEIMFNEMNGRDLDFWGITQFFKTDFDPFQTMPDGYIPDHIQSQFIAVRKTMVKSDVFHHK